MANPKRKHSKARTRKRRSQYYGKLAKHLPQLTECDHCGHPKLSHRVCPNCGYYRGRPILQRTEVV